MKRGHTRNSGKTLLILLLQHEGAKTTCSLTCSLSRGWAVPSNRVSVGAGPGVMLGACFRLSAHSLQGAVCRDHEQYPAFASDTSEMTVEFWVFWYLVIDKLLHCACSQLVAVLYDFFVFCSSRRLRHLSRCKHCSRGSQVLACLKTTLKIRDRAETVLLHGVGMKEVMLSERGGGQTKRPICI